MEENEIKWDRLAHMAAIMDKVAKTIPKTFNIGQWFAAGPNRASAVIDGQFDFDGEDVQKYPVKVEEGFCGTSACVLGHAALDPVFREQGLYVELATFVGHNGSIRVDDTAIKYDVFEDAEAGAAFFGLSETEAEVMFGMHDNTARYYGREADHEIQAEDVAIRLKRAVAERDLGMDVYGDIVP